MSDDSAWLDAEHEYQKKQVAGALADAMLAQEMPMVVPGPTLFEMAERMLSTGVRHGSDWASVTDGSVVPQWVTKGLEENAKAEVAPIVSAGALPMSGVAKAVSWKDLKL